MYELLESRAEIADAQTRLEETISASSPLTHSRSISWRKGGLSNENLQVFEGIWYLARNSRVRPNQGRMNWFGIWGERHKLDITVQINSPYEGRTGKLAGFFARNIDTDSVYLLHSGNLGGGRDGVSKQLFLAQTSLKTTTVQGSGSHKREGILVMPIQGQGATEQAAVFVRTVAAFKADASSGKFKQKAS